MTSPVIGGDGNTVNYTEQASAVTLDANLTVSDPSSPVLVSAVVTTLGDPHSGFISGDTLHFTNTATITGIYSSGVLTLSGADTVADYQAALRSITFDNQSNDDPTGASATRIVTWQVTDGISSPSNVGTTTVDVIPTDDAPVINPNPHSDPAPSYTEGLAAVTAAPNVTLTDPDNFYMSSATIRILDFQPGDVLDTSFSGISASGSYDPTTGVLTIPVDDANPSSSFDTLADYSQGIFRHLTYSSTSADPTNGGAHTTRTIAWQIHDASVATGTTALFQAPVGYPTGAGTGPVALANMFTDSLDTDVNGDLQTDLITADMTSGQVSVLVNNGGNGVFGSSSSFAAGANASSLAAGNFNEDFDPSNLSNDMVDVIVGHSTGNTLSLLLGDGNGHFAPPTPIPVGTNPQFVMVSDFNGDFHDDLAVANGGDNDIMLLYGNGNGTFQAPVVLATGVDPVFIATGEFNAPSPSPPPQGPDFAIADRGGDSVAIYQGDGAGNFTRRPDVVLPAGSEPDAIATGDFTGDHTTDLAVANFGTSTISLEVGNGDGTFTPGPVLNTVALHPTSIIAQDVDGNGRLDLVVTDQGDPAHGIDGDVEIFLANPTSGDQGQPDGTFQPPIVINLGLGTNPTSVASADFNLDGNPDLAVTDPSTNKTYVLLHTPTTASAIALSMINVRAVNNRPDVTVPASHYHATAGTNLALQAPGLKVSDADANTGTETVTLSVGEGIITVNAGNSGISNITDNGSGSVSFDGTISELDGLLEGSSTSAIVYNDPNNPPSASTLLTLAINDNNHTGNPGDMAETRSNSQIIDIAAASGGPPPAPPPVPFDFNADTISDLAFQNKNNGQPGIWLWNGTAPTAEAGINSAGGAAWHVVTARDVNGDRNSDLIWQNNDGTPGIWLMNGTTPVAELGLTNPGANWHLVGAGDVNGDSNADFIWQDTGGTLGVWEMNGPTPIAEVGLGNPGPTWKVVGAADFDHDGRDDILLQNTATGNLMIDLMNGTTIRSSVSITVGDASWHAIGTGVFNGVTEIAWQNTNGTPGIWLMNGTTPGAEAALTNPGAGWQLVSMDHFTPDGKADLLFQNTSGPMMLWDMNGTSVAAMVNLQTPGAGWQSVNGHPFATG